MKFPTKRSSLYDELVAGGYKESTRIDSPNQVLLTENKGIARNTITLKGAGIAAMSGLTNQNPSIIVKSPTELVTYQNTRTKTSALSLESGLVDDVKLQQFINASGIEPSLFINLSLYSIEVTTDGNINIKFNDIFDEGLIMLPLVDGKAYQLDQLDKLGAPADSVLKFASGRSFTKANVLANRKLVPGKTNTYFIPLIIKVKSTGEFPNFTVSAVAPGTELNNYLAIGPAEISNVNLTVGWMGVNAVTDTQFLPSAPSPLNVVLAIRQFLVSSMALTYASVDIINQLRATITNGAEVIDYDDYTSTIVSAEGESRTLSIAYNDDYDKTKRRVLHVYTIPNSAVAALATTAGAGDLIVLKVNSTNYKASQLLARLVEANGKFYVGFDLPITDTPANISFSFNVGGIDNPNTDWTVTNWVTNITQAIPQDLVVPVTQIPNKYVMSLADIDGGFKSGVKHMRVEFDVPANQEFAYGFSSTELLTIVDESIPGTFEVLEPEYSVAIRQQTLSVGKLVRNTTNTTAKLRLYIQVPMASVSQTIGSNYLVETVTTLGAVFNPATSTIKANGEYFFLGIDGTKDTIDTLGYSHRYQRLIAANQAVKYKYDSTMAQAISFGTAAPLDHTDVTMFQSSVVHKSQTKVLMTSDGYIYRADESGFSNIDRVDLREGIYIEAALDATGKGIVITQLQYPNNDVTQKPYILNVNEFPNVLNDITGGISVHVSGLNLTKDTTLYLTDIYDVVKVVPEIVCDGSTSTFLTNVEGIAGSTIQVNDAAATDLTSWLTNHSSKDGEVITFTSESYDASTRLRVRKVSGFLTEAQVAQANKAFVIYDRFGNILDTALNTNYTTVNGIRGIKYSGLDVCLSKLVYPDVDLTGALTIANDITVAGEWVAQLNGEPIDTEALTVEELKAKLAADHSDVEIHVLTDISCEGSKHVTEEMDLTGRWYIQLGDEIISHEDMSLPELQAYLLTQGIEMQIK